MFVVYEIRILTSDLRYVGSSGNFHKRMDRHIRDLNKGQHHNKTLQSLYNKGLKLEFNVLLETESREEAKDYEQHLLNTCENLCNMSKWATCGDLISYHPDKVQIITRMSETLKEGYSLGKYSLPNKQGELNPNWKGGISFKTSCSICGVTVSAYSKYCTTCSKFGELNPFYGKQHTEATKQKLRDANKGKLPVNTMKVIVNDKEYISATVAGRELNCSTATVLNRCRSDKFPNWSLKV